MKINKRVKRKTTKPALKTAKSKTAIERDMQILRDALDPPEHLHDGFMLLHCPIWTTADGRKLRVDRMSDRHLMNAYAHINKRVRLYFLAIERLANVRSAMNAVLTSRGLQERPGEEPPFPEDYTEYPDNAYVGYRRSTSRQPRRDDPPSPIHDPMGYLQWAQRNRFP